jgi:glycerol-3-phosphate O-acyltransferase
MLDYIVTAKANPDFTAPLFVIPTAINYDRVLEDRVLGEELMGQKDRSTRAAKLRQTFDYVFRSFFRGLLKRFKRYGYAAVAFGEPILIDEWVRTEPGLIAGTFESRKPSMEKLADTIMERISGALPMTPVPIVARMFRERQADEPLGEMEIISGIDDVQREFSKRLWLTREKSAREIWEAAHNVLELRHLVVKRESGWRWNPDEILLRDYYANTLIPYREVRERGWPDRRRATGDRSQS